jgi:hypothetical protein
MNKKLLKEIKDRAEKSTIVLEMSTPKMGRPPIYDKEVHPVELVNLMEQGYLDVQVYAKWSITKVTFYEWKRHYSEFAEAHEIGMPKCEAFYIRKAQERLEAGDDAGFKYFIAIVNNKFGWGKEGSAGNTININNMNVFKDQSRDELLEYVQDRLLESNITTKVIDCESTKQD